VSPGEWAGLISAITGGVTAILGAIGALVLQLRRISPNERHAAADQASSTDEAQNEQLRLLQEKLDRLERGEEPPP
jgi:hypothetical protein